MRKARKEPEKYRVLYEDECSQYRQPSQAWLWSKMGRTQPIARWSTKTNTLLRIGGALDAITGEFHYLMGPRFRAEEFCKFLKKIASSYQMTQKVYLIIDNVSLHFTQDVKSLLKRLKKVELVPLPSYSPWLNNIEKLWKWMKQKVIHMHPWCDDFRKFKCQVKNVLESVNSNRSEILTYVGLGSN